MNPNQSNSTATHSDTSEQIEDVFDTCTDCGRLLNPSGKQHSCPAEDDDDLELVPANRREHRDIRIRADDLDPQDDVLTLRAGGHTSAYHVPTETDDDEYGDLRPDCKRPQRHEGREYETLERGLAQAKRKFPCNECYPDVAERAARMYHDDAEGDSSEELLA